MRCSSLLLPIDLLFFVNIGLGVRRYFGQSTGEPRHTLDPEAQVDDFISAVSYVRSRVDVDSSRVCVWGVSYAGAHALSAAAKTSALRRFSKSKSPVIRCVVTQVPFLGPTPHESQFEEYSKRGWLRVARAMLAGASAFARAKFLELPPLYTPLYGHYGDSIMPLTYFEDIGETEEVWVGKHLKKRPNDWRNCFLTLSIFDMMGYQPLDNLRLISNDTAVFIVAAKHDEMTPYRRSEYAAKEILSRGRSSDQVEYWLLDVKHFDLYFGDVFKTVVDKQIKFIEKHVPAPPFTGEQDEQGAGDEDEYYDDDEE